MTAEPTKIRELVEARGRKLLYLPSRSYSSRRPSKVKNLPYKAEARSRETLVEAMGTTISSLTRADIRGFFEHISYRTLGQPFSAHPLTIGLWAYWLHFC